jgi:hypothetical protein
MVEIELNIEQIFLIFFNKFNFTYNNIKLLLYQ